MSNFHGYNKKKCFFEGWYFKHQIGNDTISFIPGVSVGMDGNKIAFIQVVTKEVAYDIHYSYGDFNISEDKLNITIGKNTFSEEGISIDIEERDLTIKGAIKYTGLTPIDYDIMGPFSKLPFMECNHGIISLYHKLRGSIKINDKEISLENGIGYIEKDWGKSFPRSYIWLQCNDFKEGKSSIMLSIADIPFLGMRFRGCIAVVYYNGMEHRLATYNGAKILRAEENGIILGRKKERLEVDIIKKSSQTLVAPIRGAMSRNIREHFGCSATFKFYIEGRLEFTLRSENCSFEYVKDERVKIKEEDWNL